MTAPAPFRSEFVIRLLTHGPTLRDELPRDPVTNAELARYWGRVGERVCETWSVHGAWLKAAAVERNIPPRWRGRYFAEAVAAGK